MSARCSAGRGRLPTAGYVNYREYHDEVLAPESEPDATNEADALVGDASGVAELVVRPRSAAIGMPVFPRMMTSNGDLMILAIQRQSEALGPRDTGLATGDTLLVQDTWDAREASEDDADVLVVDSPALVRSQAVPLGPGAGQTIAVLVAMVVLLATGVVPTAVAGLLAASALVLLRVRSVTQAYRAINWTVIVLVGGMIPLSHFLQSTGAADQIVQGLLHVIGDAGPYPLLIGLLLVCAVLGQLIGNTATALVVIPITVSAAMAFGVSVRPMLMAVNLMCAPALLTPVATPGNLMVMGPGGYQFGEGRLAVCCCGSGGRRGLGAACLAVLMRVTKRSTCCGACPTTPLGRRADRKPNGARHTA
jgi:di/tricarboxylate transporter